jgi:hypothetical protein
MAFSLRIMFRDGFGLLPPQPGFRAATTIRTGSDMTPLKTKNSLPNIWSDVWLTAG